MISNHSVYKDGTLLFEAKGSVAQDFLTEVYHFLDTKYPKFYKMDGLSKLGWLAAEIALKDFKSEAYDPYQVGIMLCNANSSLDTDLKYWESAKTFASPALFVYTLPNIVIGEICIRHKFRGENAFFVTEQFQPAFVEQYVNNLVNNNILQACICGWIELLEESYRATIFVVEKEHDIHVNAVPFSAENMTKIYQLHHG